MVRALWTAATGMTSQQTNVDTISNNLANINTTGYKKQTAEFKSLLYQTIQENSYDNNGNAKPYGIQVGLGVRNSAISSQFSQGILVDSDNDTDFAISGNGFFMVQKPDGQIAYTRNGSFQWVLGTQGLTLSTSDGNPVLDTNGQPIVVDNSYDSANIYIDDYGNLYYKEFQPTDSTSNTDGTDTTNTTTSTTKETKVNLGIQIGVAQFNNPGGLSKLADSLLQPTDASGAAIMEATDTSVTRSKIKQGYLEGSNVQAVDEMVNLIVAQRAYEMNSKVINAADEMLQQANNLRS
jgi:flagellar basal-body rod protein FlgG